MKYNKLKKLVLTLVTFGALAGISQSAFGYFFPEFLNGYTSYGSNISAQYLDGNCDNRYDAYEEYTYQTSYKYWGNHYGTFRIFCDNNSVVVFSQSTGKTIYGQYFGNAMTWYNVKNNHDVRWKF